MARGAAAYYPAFLDLWHKRVVVIGGGQIATGKVQGLLPCQPRPLVVVAPRASQPIQQAARDGQLEWIARGYAPGDLAGAALAFAASDDRALNAQVAAEARRRSIPVLAVDDVPNCDFIAPALVRRGDLVIAISTSGRSPAMARRARESLDELVPRHWGDLLEVVATARQRLGQTRRRLSADQWQAAIDTKLETLVRRGELESAIELLVSRLQVLDSSG